MNRNFVYFEEYGSEFRQGYDVANVVSAMKELLKSFYIDKETRKLYIVIHKDNVSICEGICAENLFHTELKNPESKEESTKGDDEVWFMIIPSKMIK